MKIWYVYFVEDTKTPLLIQAYHDLNGLENANLCWIKTDEILQTTNFNKHCSYIFGYFHDKAIEYLKSYKILIFGPQCLLDYLRNDETLPTNENPLFSTALKNVEVCFTGYNEEMKKELTEKVIMMHGTVSKDLNASAKVLISPSVGTRKYRAASEIGIPVVSRDWIEKIWELTKNTDPLDGMEEYWLEQYRIPIFHNLQISLTGFSILEREVVEKIIRKCGGFYNPDLTVGVCTHLIAMQASGEKFECAKKWKILTVHWKWLVDSVSKGYACDEKKYLLSGKAHVPGLSQQTESSNSNNSNNNSNSAGLNDTISCENDIDKKIWADCVIQFLACETEFIEKWTSLISEFGGEVCKGLIDLSVVFVTHIIVGDVSKLEKTEEDITYVSRDWLQACLDEETLANPKQFAIELPELPTVAPIVNPLPDLSIDWDILNEYNVTKPIGNHIETENKINSFGIFAKCRFLLHNLPSIQNQTISSLIINNSGIVDIVPNSVTHVVLSDVLCNQSNRLLPKYANIVTVFYLTECVRQKQLLPIESDFMFTPLDIDPNILVGTVLSFSGYSAEERNLLKSICSSAGATVQDQMSRKPIPDKNILATTHLIISKPDKKKFPSSKSWNIPAVTKRWIGDSIGSRGIIPTDIYALELEGNSGRVGNTEMKQEVRKRKASEEIDIQPISKRKICENVQLSVEKSGRIFVVCTIDRNRYKTLGEAVKELGGTLELGADFNGEFTHLVSGKPGRTEKYLAAIAAGKWVLHTSYIDDSMAAGRWLEEDRYQWGGPLTSQFVEGCTFTKFDLALADAAKRFHNNGGDPFKGWRVCLVEEKEKFEKISRIVEAGGGTIVTLIEPIKELNVTHFLINKNLCVGLPDLSSYPCYEIDLIAFYLSARNEVEKKKFMKKFTVPVTEMNKLLGKASDRSRSSRKSKIF